MLAQEARFPIEVIVGDDASTDGTREIVEAYGARHPDKIRAVLHERNLGGHGSGNFLAITALARGEYLCVLEGDDLFTDREKLQIQADFLDREPGCAGCFHVCSVVDDRGILVHERFELKSRGPRVTQEAIIVGGNNSVTNTRMYRARCVERLPRWYLTHTIDWSLEILVAGFGDWGFVPRTMSAYRLHGGGVFSAANLVRQHETIVRVAIALLAEPSFSAYREPLRQRLAWMNREMAQASRAEGQWHRFVSYLMRSAYYSRKDVRLLKSLLGELVR